MIKNGSLKNKVSYNQHFAWILFFLLNILFIEISFIRLIRAQIGIMMEEDVLSVFNSF